MILSYVNNMKRFNFFKSLLLIVLVFQVTQGILIGQSMNISLTLDRNFQYTVNLQFPQQRVQNALKKMGIPLQETWFVFVDIQAASQITWPDIYVDFYIEDLQDPQKVHHKKECTKQGIQMETCYLSSEDFNYKQEKLRVKVSTDEKVDVLLKSEIVRIKKLDFNTCFKIDTALAEKSNKLFRIDMKQVNVKFEEIRITLTPINHVYENEPIHIYGSFGKYVPTPQHHDFSSFYAWQMSVTTRIHREQLLQTKEINLLIDVPQNYLFDLDTTIIINHNDSIQLKTGEYYDDILAGFQSARKYLFSISHPQLNNFVRIKKYGGFLMIRDTKIIVKNDDFKGDMNFLREFRNQEFLAQETFMIQKGIKVFQITVTPFGFMQGVIYTVETYENSLEYNWINEGATHLSELASKQKSYFLARVVRHKNQVQKLSEALIKLVLRQGAVSQRIFSCLVQQVQKCVQMMKKSESQIQQGKKQRIFEQISNSQQLLDQISEIKVINLQLDKQKFISYTEQYKQQVIIIEVTGHEQFPKNLFSIQFLNVGILDTLSQHERKTNLIEEEQFKIYRFTVPHDTSIHSLAFHISTYYGYVERLVTNVNPSGKTQDQLIDLMNQQPIHFVRSYQNLIQIEKVEIEKTYYLVVFAKIKSYIGIRVQLKNTMSHPESEKNLTYSTVLLSSLNSYDFVVGPKQLIIFDIRMIHLPVLFLKASSVIPLDVCMNIGSQMQKLPLEPDCSIRHQLGKKYEIYIHTNIFNTKFSLYNGNDGYAKLKISLQNYERCVPKALGEKQFFHSSMFAETGQNEMCLNYNLYKKGSLLVSIKPSSVLKRKSLKAQFKIGNLSHSLTKLQTIIDEQQVEKGCEDMYNTCLGSLIVEVNKEAGETPQALLGQQFILQVQYTDQTVDLLDGLGYTYIGHVSNEKPKLFKYGLYDIQRPINVVLDNLKGFYQVLVKVSGANELYKYPTLEQFKAQNPNEIKIFKTDNSMFYLYETLRIQAQVLLKLCDPMNINYWRACNLLISVYPDSSQNSIVDGKFNIQVVQYVSILRQHEPVPGYVESNMMNFYEISSTVQNSTIIVTVNSRSSKKHKQKKSHCFQIYAKFGIQQKATNSNSRFVSEKGVSELIITKAQKGTYSVTVHGLQTSDKYCEYSIQYSVLPPSKQQNEAVASPIKMIRGSTPFDLQMKTAQKAKYFLFFNGIESNNFKIMTLFQTLGQVLISVMALPSDQSHQAILSKVSSLDSIFISNWKSSNILEIKKDDQKYCSDCLYLIKLQCLKQFKGQIIIPDYDAQISVKSNAIVYDQLIKDKRSLYRVYTGSHLAFKLNLISGNVRIKITLKQTNRTIFEKNYTATNIQKIEIVELQNKLSYEYNRYVLFEIYCIQDSHFIFGIVRDYNKTEQSRKQAQKKQSQDSAQQFVKKTDALMYGVPKNIQLASNQKKCLSGTLQQDLTFIISRENVGNDKSGSNQSLSDTQIQFWIKKASQQQRVKISSHNLGVKVSQNSMIIKLGEINDITQLNGMPNSFELCLKYPQKIYLSIIQSSHVNYFPPNTDILIHQNINLTFMAGADNILEINECSGHSLISISKDFGTVHSLESQITQIRRPNSLIQFKEKGPVFLSTQSTGLMSIQWKQVEYENGVNVGYFMYEPGNFKILMNQDDSQKSSLQIFPLKKTNFNAVSESNLPIPQTLTYEIYIQKEEVNLYQAMNCHQEIGMKIIEQVSLSTNLRQTYSLEFYSMNELKQKFGDFQQLVVSIKAILKVKNAKGLNEQYRFFYPYQEIIDQSYKAVSESQDGAQSPSNKTFGDLEIVIILVMLFSIVIILVCLRKQIKRVYMRMTSRQILIPQYQFQMKTQMESPSSYYHKTQN